MPVNPASPLPLLLILALACSLPPPSLADPTSKAQDGGSGKLHLWCVAKNNAEDATLQTALDWACGPGGADCGPIQQGGACYDSADVQKMASYAFNDYYRKHGMADDSCYFDNNAAPTNLDPSDDKCKMPSSVVVNNASLSGSPTTVSLGPSADLNGSRSKMVRGWFLPIVFGHLLLVSMLGFQGL